MVVSQQLLVFLLKMIIFGGVLGVAPFKETPISLITYWCCFQLPFFIFTPRLSDRLLHEIHLGRGAALLSGCVYQPTVAKKCSTARWPHNQKKGSLANLNSTPSWRQTLRNSGSALPMICGGWWIWVHLSWWNVRYLPSTQNPGPLL